MKATDGATAQAAIGLLAAGLDLVESDYDEAAVPPAAVFDAMLDGLDEAEVMGALVALVLGYAQMMDSLSGRKDTLRFYLETAGPIMAKAGS